MRQEDMAHEDRMEFLFLLFFYIFHSARPLTSVPVGLIINKEKPTDWSDEEKIT